jgi:hypothetical protein
MRSSIPTDTDSAPFRKAGLALAAQNVVWRLVAVTCADRADCRAHTVARRARKRLNGVGVTAGIRPAAWLNGGRATRARQTRVVAKKASTGGVAKSKGVTGAEHARQTLGRILARGACLARFASCRLVSSRAIDKVAGGTVEQDRSTCQEETQNYASADGTIRDSSPA